MDQRIVEALIVTSVPILLPFLFRSGRALYGRGWRWLKRKLSTNEELLLELRAMNSKVDRVLHEVLPNNGGSMRDEMGQQHAMTLALFSDPDEGQFYTNRNGDLVWASETFCRWTGLALRDLQGRGWLSAVAERDQDAFIRNFETALSQKREFRGVYFLRAVSAPTDTQPGGVRRIRTEWRVSVVRNDKGDQIVGYKGSVRHIVTGQQSAVAGFPEAATA